MQSASILAVVFAAAFVPAAEATQCFSMFDARNTLVYQSTTAPVDLSGPVSDAMRRRYPARSLVIADSGVCREVGGSASAATLRTTGSLSSDTSSGGPSSSASSGSSASSAPSGMGDGSDASRDRPVRGYMRNDGVAVSPYPRSAPGSRR